MPKLFTHRNTEPREMSEASVQSRWIGHELQETLFLLLDSELKVSKDVRATELNLVLVVPP